ncbi:MAG: GrpB family protein [Armatimonadetes bacterium]|nr:GrpB family protein [Armatimonadota bacterium]
MLMRIRGHDIELTPYDPQAPRVFAELADHLRPMLPAQARIEHVGSTAVPGLGGKGIIDALVLVEPEQAPQVAAVLWDAGFDMDADKRHQAEDWWYAAGVFERPDGRRYLVHVHVTWPGSRFAADLLDFRDYLRAHPEEAAEYDRLKRKWREQAGDSREKFTNLKSPYVASVLARARAKE